MPGTANKYFKASSAVNAKPMLSPNILRRKLLLLNEDVVDNQLPSGPSQIYATRHGECYLGHRDAGNDFCFR